MKKLFVCLIVFLCAGQAVFAKHVYPERYYQNLWCEKAKGIQEYELKDFTRVDCLTSTHAIEFDFGKKWAESIGQSLHYSLMTGKKAGIVLIIETDKDWVYFNRIKPLCEKYNITLWSMKLSDI